MQKVYLLLRNNRQTGPHSLEELLQLQLQPFDLIWVEGKSYGWAYPTEVESLKPFVATVNGSPNNAAASEDLTTNDQRTGEKKIFVSLPITGGASPVPDASPQAKDPIEKKAEELRRRAETYVPPSFEQSGEIQTHYTRSINQVEEDYTSWMFKKRANKKKFVTGKTIAFASIILIGLAGAWWLGRTDQPDYISDKPLVQRNIVTMSAEAAKTNSNGDFVVNPVNTTPLITIVKKVQPAISKPKKQISQPKQNSEVSLPKESATIESQTEPANETATIVIQEEKEGENEVAQKPQEKRTLRGLFNDLFKKKKNNKQKEQEETPSVSTAGTERKASRRNDEGSNTIDITNDINVKLNKKTGDWMMGVQGMKLTLHNGSSSYLQSASVEILYYSEQEEVLQNKILHFSNIAANKTASVAIPDHRLADHVEYRIVSATGTSNAYAKQ
ncbi:MAG TPA: hypothetical protein VFQ73_09215 [Flavisolibacter sp.]|nr:hypothetical protein [Flavisolibacter sp.]